MSKINIEYATDNTVSYLHTNPDFVKKKVNDNIYDSSWLNESLNGQPFIQLKYKVEDFDLKLDANGNYNKVMIDNAITLYESLKDLPRRLLTEERFWLWITFKKCYRASIQSMGNRIEGQWIFTRGIPRSIWFNVHSRSYFWVECTVKDDSNDKYEYTKFALEKIERIRNLTFDSNKPKNIIYNAIRAEKAIYDKYSKNPEYEEAYKKCESGSLGLNIYEKIRKDISLYGSVRLLSVMSDEDIFKFVYNKIEEILLEVKNGNTSILSK